MPQDEVIGIKYGPFENKATPVRRNTSTCHLLPPPMKTAPKSTFWQDGHGDRGTIASRETQIDLEYGNSYYAMVNTLPLRH